MRTAAYTGEPEERSLDVADHVGPEGRLLLLSDGHPGADAWALTVDADGRQRVLELETDVTGAVATWVPTGRWLLVTSDGDGRVVAHRLAGDGELVDRTEVAGRAPFPLPGLAVDEGRVWVFQSGDETTDQPVQRVPAVATDGGASIADVVDDAAVRIGPEGRPWFVQVTVDGYEVTDLSRPQP